MKIYGSSISPFVRMTLVTAHECGLEGKVEHVNESADPTKVNTHLEAMNPIGKIPVLETDHHHPIYDSRVIMEYLAHVAGNKSLFPDDGVKRFRVLTLQALALGLGDSAVAYRYETATRPKELQWKEWMARTQSRFAAIFDDLEKTWSDDLSHVTAGTIAAACVLGYIDYRMADLNWRAGRPKLAAVHKTFSTRSSMVKTALPAV
jgi:glutathione S-transferase